MNPFSRNLLLVGFCVLIAAAVTACSGVSWSITISGCTSGTCASSGKPVAKLTSTDISTFDASQIVFTITATGGVIDGPGYFTVTLKNNGTTVAANSFPYTRSGDNYTATNSSTVNSWVQANAVPGDDIVLSAWGIDIGLVQGSNTVTATTNVGGHQAARATSTFMHNQY